MKLRVEDGVLKASDAALTETIGEGKELSVHLQAKGLLLAGAPDDQTPWMAGSLACSSVIEIAELLSSASETGALQVFDPRGHRTLYFERGEYVGGQSNHKSDRLGKVLWRTGAIALDQLMIAEANITKEKRLGRMLVEMGYMRAKDLRSALWRQARSIFFAASIEPEGTFVFLRGSKNRNAIRYGVQTSDLLDDAVDAYREVQMLLKVVAPLDDDCRTVVPAPEGALDDNEQALLQLAMSARQTALTKREVIERSDIGLLDGVRVLHRLQSGGYFVENEDPIDEKSEREPKIEVLCRSINLVMKALRGLDVEAGAGVRGFLADPPEHLEEVLSGLNVEGELDPKNVRIQAEFAEGGNERMEHGLVLVLDFALFEARDRLPEEKSDALDDQLEAWGAFE